MSRWLWFLYGLAVNFLFLLAFLYTVAFIADVWVPRTIDAGPSVPPARALLTDLLLLGLFALQHSGMARSGFKAWWSTRIPPAAERSTYVLASTAVLVLLLWQWRPILGDIWRVEHPLGALALQGIYWLAWLLPMAAALQLNPFKHFGLLPLYRQLRDRPPLPEEFRTPGLYNVMRQPVLLGYLIAFWATPRMTAGHLLFAAVMTVYIVAGGLLSEREMARAFGKPYQAYRRRVPMLLPFPRGKSP